MKPFGVLISIVFFLNARTVLAHSNIQGFWADGGKTLSIQILDRIGEGPFTAAQIWDSIKPDHLDSEGHRVVKTDHLEIKCEMTVSSMGAFGSCEINASDKIVTGNVGTQYFAITQQEAQAALDSFIEARGDLRLMSGFKDSYGNEAFMFEANRHYGIIAGGISNFLMPH